MIRVRADGDRAFLRKQAEDLRRRGRRQLDKAIQSDPTLRDAAIEDQAHAMFHARTAVRNLAEIVAAEFLLLLEAERTVVGRDHLKIIHAKSIPEFFLIRLVAQRRRHHVFRAFKAGAFVVGVVEKQILRAGFGKSGQSEVPCVLNLA